MGRRAIAPLFVLLVVAGVHLWSYADSPMGHIHGDGYYTYLWARSLAFDGDLDLTNDYELCGDPWRMTSRREAEPDWWPHNTWSVGPSLVWAPMVAVARLFSSAAQSENAEIAQGCRGTLANFSMLGTLFMGLLAVWLAYRMARRHVGVGPSLLGAAGVALASPLPYYSTLLPSYGHAPAAFGVALALERWDATRNNRRLVRWAFIGGLIGLAMLMRAQNGLIALAPLIEWLALARQDLRDKNYRRLGWLVLAGVLFMFLMVLVFFPQLYIWKHTYGTYFALPQGPNYMRWDHPNLDGVFFGSTGGLLVWTPLMYGALIGIFVGLFRRKTRMISLVLLLIVATFTYVNASVWDWWGSMGFSNRRYTALALPLAIGLAISCERLFAWAQRRPRHFAGATLGVALAGFALWNYGLMWSVAKGHIHSWKEDRFDHVMRVNFIDLTTEMHDAVGNPFAWPASIPWAIAHDTHPRRYDVMRGMGVFYQEFETKRVRTRAAQDTANFGRGVQFDYAVQGFEHDIRTVKGRSAAIAHGRYARMLIPFFADDVSAIEMEWVALRGRDAGIANLKPGKSPKGHRRASARVALRWNGRPVAHATVAARWETTRIVLPPNVVEVGVNELEWEIEGGPIAFVSMKALQAPTEDDP